MEGNKQTFRIVFIAFLQIVVLLSCTVHRKSGAKYSIARVTKIRAQQDSSVVIGKVYDLSNGYGIQSGIIAVDDIKIGTLVDSCGGYRLVLPPGRHKLHCGVTFYEDLITGRIACRQGATIIVNFFVKCGPFEH